MSGDLVLRGSYSAKIDAKGRLKIPTAFRPLIEDKPGGALFITSVDAKCVRVYSLAAWQAVEARLSRVPSEHPSRKKFLNRVNYFGQMAELDAQGRVSIPLRVREAASIVGDVDVLGLSSHLEVWNHERFVAKLDSEPFTEADARDLAEFGI